MALDIVYGVIRNRLATDNLVNVINNVKEITEDESTLFLGYPLTAKVDESITIDALLFTKSKGLVAFIIHDKGANEYERQDKLFYDLKYALAKYDKLRKGRNSAITQTVITYFGAEEMPIAKGDEYVFVNDINFANVYKNLEGLDPKFYDILCESIYKISSMKPKKKRKNVERENSKGAIIKKIEKEVANLDQWQKKAAYEVPDAPQQIRGLAGSGKTVVLALKAAYLHSQHPDWNIIVTFFTRSLKQQYEQLISSFMLEFSDEAPNWNRLKIIHSWGTNTELGVYSIAAQNAKLMPYDFMAAKRKYGAGFEFSGICGELLNIGKDNIQEDFDVILIDEAQDLPVEFFKLCYQMVKDPKRIVFAYDELQNLNNLNSISSDQIFGINEDGTPIVTLRNEENQPRQDIVLPVCYRNTKWALTIAHALGFGIYREKGMIQGFEHPRIWENIGYAVKNGKLKTGNKVKLYRGKKSTPSYFAELITPEDAFISQVFKNEEEQYNWIAREIKKNIEEDELDPDDILVVFPDAYSSQSTYNTFNRYLRKYGVNSILAGITTSRDTFKIPEAVTCASIFRAKGNEFPMVYIADAHWCNSKALDIITARNVLFTAITRARAWVRVCGYGQEMVELDQEIQKCINLNYVLDFKNPTEEELMKMKSLYKTVSKENLDLLASSKTKINQILDLYRRGEIGKEDLSELMEMLSILKDD